MIVTLLFKSASTSAGSISRVIVTALLRSASTSAGNISKVIGPMFRSLALLSNFAVTSGESMERVIGPIEMAL